MAIPLDHTAVGALGIGFALDNDPSRLLPRASLVVKAGKEPLRITRLFVLFDCLLQQFFAVSLQFRHWGFTCRPGRELS